MDAHKILIVEDDPEINQLLTKYLQKEGYQTDSAFNGLEALERFARTGYQLVILDLMMPKLDGHEVLRRIREKGNVPVLIVSAKSEEVDKIVGLGLGADDYMTKPFGIGELIARVKAQMRRYLYLNDAPAQDEQEEPDHLLKHGDLTLDLNTYQVQIGDEKKTLTAKEFEILKLFLKNPTRVFTKSQIFQAVWQEEYLADENTVMVHIRRLRTKIEADASNPEYIQTVWGIGYKLGENGR
jgi:DNA-binding response OmpR family regulator